MTRLCRIGGCLRNAAKRRSVCWQHKYRLANFGDPHTDWHTLTDPDQLHTVVDNRLPDHGLTYRDRRTAAAQLNAAGLHPRQIAALLGVSERTIWRWQAAGRAAV